MKIAIEFEIDSSFRNEDGSIAQWEIGVRQVKSAERSKTM